MNQSTEYTRSREPVRRGYPEMHVGFPERNDATYPEEERDLNNGDEDRERVHVDPETMTISRKNAGEIDRENRQEHRADESETDEQKKGNAKEGRDQSR